MYNNRVRSVHRRIIYTIFTYARRRASDRTIARLCGGDNFSLPGGGDSFVDPRSVGARSTTRTRSIAWSPDGREEEGATPFLRPGGGGEERRKKCGMERR